jgi:hypothetical protein
MLQSLKRLLRRRDDLAQLVLDFGSAPRDSAELLERLRGLGLRRIDRCSLTRNRKVMVSFGGGGGVLRVHEGYLAAPPDILRAIVVFVEGRTRAERRIAQRVIVSFAVPGVVATARQERTRPEDRQLAQELAGWHAEYNARHFDGRLGAIPIRVSRRMRSRLGHYTARANGDSGEIAISWRHIRKHGRDEALQTLLHEMVHQWQDESGHPIDHGALFRAKARQVGTPARARRALDLHQRRLPSSA